MNVAWRELRLGVDLCHPGVERPVRKGIDPDTDRGAETQPPEIGFADEYLQPHAIEVRDGCNGLPGGDHLARLGQPLQHAARQWRKDAGALQSLTREGKRPSGNVGLGIGLRALLPEHADLVGRGHIGVPADIDLLDGDPALTAKRLITGEVASTGLRMMPGEIALIISSVPAPMPATR